MNIEKNKEKIKESVKRIIDRYPDKIPVFVKRGRSDKCLKDIEQNKFIIPEDITIAQFMNILRKRIKLEPTIALYLFINGSVLPAQTATMSSLYETYKNEELLLEIDYCGENTFGKIK
tara:strand:+ start:65 stop:418 length:354 start_codon:yes stop_codon:yes gene_type:complete